MDQSFSRGLLEIPLTKLPTYDKRLLETDDYTQDYKAPA